MTYQDLLTSILTGIIIFATTVLIRNHFKRYSFWSSRGIPGPTPWPLMGTNIYYLFNHKLELEAHWHRVYGKSFGLYEGHKPVLRTIDVDVVNFYSIKQFASFHDRDSGAIYGKTQRHALLWAKGESWANQRVLVSPMFTSLRMRLMLGNMSHCMSRFMDRVEGDMKKQLESRDENKLQLGKRDISQLTLDVIASCFFGLKLNTYEARENEFLKRAYEFADFDPLWLIIWLATPTPIARYFELNLFRQSKQEYFRQLVQQIVQERRLNIKYNNKQKQQHDVIQAFLDARIPETYSEIYTQEDNREAHYSGDFASEQLEEMQRKQTSAAQATKFRQFTDDEIYGQMIFMLLAGFETTASTLTFAIYELAHQPQVQDKLRAELMQEFDCKDNQELIDHQLLTTTTTTTTTKGDSNDVNSKLSHLKLLDAFVCEVLRLYSPIIEHNRMITNAEGVSQVPTKPQPIDLPAGVTISTNRFLLQRDRDYFPYAPNEFRLERFLPENRDKIKSGSFMPFGLGPRHCAGMRFALMEVKLALARLVARFEVHVPPTNQLYPPKFTRNAVFLQAHCSDFELRPRRRT